MGEPGARALALIVVLFVTACGDSAQTSRVHYPRAPAAAGDASRLQLVFNRAVSGLTVSVNGQLVAEGITTRRLLISGIESGYADLVLAGDGVEKATRVWLDAGQTVALPIAAVPVPKQTNPFVATALSIVALMVTQSAQHYIF
jgi:hypothetical protein